ncbi:CPBP family intramembrane glutamic endopeptidase [Treponema sp.]|uniref:CPBP family intramembrane glutamic endopeptidase n=1 Tax=Treponema sp. TaxID=166 RepID=UPI003F0629BA
MKKRYILAEFLIVLAFLVVPPLFAEEGASLGNGISLSVISELVAASLLQIQHLSMKRSCKPTPKEHFCFVVRSLKWGALTLGHMMLVFSAVQLISFAMRLSPSHSGVVLFHPEKISSWIFVAVTLAAGAFFEEVLYRQYLPETLATLLGERKIPAEILSVLLFALAHRYLGWISVLNAVLCGAFLRLCRVKTGAVVSSAAAHFLYNLSLTVFSVLL